MEIVREMFDLRGMHRDKLVLCATSGSDVPTNARNDENMSGIMKDHRHRKFSVIFYVNSVHKTLFHNRRFWCLPNKKLI